MAKVYLGIQPPEVVIDQEGLDELYAYSDGSKIYIRDVPQKPDDFFALAHEARHVWQYQTNKDYFLKDYRNRKDCRDTDDYNSQLAEIDANALAVLVMEDLFGLTPLFEGYSERLREKIYDYADKLSEEI